MKNESPRLSGPLFLPYQLRWLNDDSPVKIWEKSRRIGATFAQSYEDVSDVLRGKVKSVWFSSADESAAREYIAYCRLWAGLFSCAAQEAGLVTDGAAAENRLMMHFANGGRIIALSSNPKSFRSKGGKVVLDEFAHHSDARALWKAAKPAVTWGYPLRILSTHNGKLSLFYDFIESVRRGELKWSAHRTDIFTAAREGLTARILGNNATAQEREAWLNDIRLNCFEERVWQEEYCCLPVDEATAFLPLDELRACVDVSLRAGPAEISPSGTNGETMFLGVDIGRKHDATVMYLLARRAGKLTTAGIQVLKNTDFRAQEEALYRYLALPEVRTCAIDATGMGAHIAETAAQRFGKSKVEAVHFTAALKEELAYALKRAVSDKSIALPDDALLLEDLHRVRRQYTPSGNIIFDSPRGGGDGHSDRFWALALALRAAASAPASPVVIRSRVSRQQFVREHNRRRGIF